MFFRFNSRKTMHVLGLVLACLFILSGSVRLSGEEEEIVKVETFISRDGIRTGDSFKVAFLIRIRSGWHINANELADEFLIPTKMSIEENKEVKVEEYYYPEPRLEKYDYSDFELQVFEGEVVLGALVETKKELENGEHVLKASLRYQACDIKSCLPPKTLQFEIPFVIVSSSEETKEINKDIFSKIKFKEDSAK